MPPDPAQATTTPFRSTAVRPGVVLVGDWPPPPGGVATHLRGLAQMGRKRDFDVTVLDIAARRGDVGEVIEGVRRLAVSPRGTLWPVLHRVSEGTAATHLHTSGSSLRSWVLTAGAGRGSRSHRRLVTFHSGRLPVFLQESPLHRTVASFALRGWSHVIAVSEALAVALRPLVSPPTRVLVVSPFVPIDGGAVDASRLPPPPGRPLVVALSAPPAHYGIADLRAACAGLRADFPQLHLVVLGPASESWTAPGITGAGPCDHETVLAWMRAADVFVRPTLVDGDALSVREALSLGRPVVASDAARRPSGSHLHRAGDPGDLQRVLASVLAGAGDACVAAPPSEADVSRVSDLWIGGREE